MKVYKSPNYSYITIVELSKQEIQIIDMSICSQPKQTLKAYYDSCKVKPTIICNGGLFNMSDGKTVLNYKDNGVIINNEGAWANEGFGITKTGELQYGSFDNPDFVDFVTGYPILIKNGLPTTPSLAKELNYKTRRTVLAYNKDNIYIIAIENPGMNFIQMQTFLVGLGVDYAINLDGGGSTKILQDGKSITSTLNNRAVDNVIAVYLKPKIIYRVQLGAFSKKPGADKFVEEVRYIRDTIGAGYKNAYVRKVGNYYKVQVGAFSKKENATKVVNDLKTKGYNAFITTN